MRAAQRKLNRDLVRGSAPGRNWVDQRCGAAEEARDVAAADAQTGAHARARMCGRTAACVMAMRARRSCGRGHTHKRRAGGARARASERATAGHASGPPARARAREAIRRHMRARARADAQRRASSPCAGRLARKRRGTCARADARRRLLFGGMNMSSEREHPKSKQHTLSAPDTIWRRQKRRR